MNGYPSFYPRIVLVAPSPGRHVTGTCVYKTEITSGSRKWGHLPTIGIPKAIYHYVTNTTKQQPTYQLFQNIMRPKNQLVNPPKMKKFNSICAFSRFLLQLWYLKLDQLANQSGSSRPMSTVIKHHIGSLFCNRSLFIPMFFTLSCIVLRACPLSSPVSISSVCRSPCLYCM